MSKLRDAIYGFVVGDALGVPGEFLSRYELKLSPIKEMRSGGFWDKPKGTWSDDSSMTLATLDSIKRNGGRIRLEDMMQSFTDWYVNGAYTQRGTFDIGHGTREALNRYIHGCIPAALCGGNQFYDNGNGSLMRILPLAFIDCSDDDIRKVSSLTHRHIISKTACVIYVNIARGLIEGKKIMDIINDMSSSYFTGDVNCFQRLPYIDKLKEDDINSSGYVVDTLEAVCWCIATTNSYKEAVLKAVNLGEDTDTIGAITGGLAGIIYGYDSIPKEWIDDIDMIEEIERYLW